MSSFEAFLFSSIIVSAVVALIPTYSKMTNRCFMLAYTAIAILCSALFMNLEGMDNTFSQAMLIIGMSFTVVVYATAPTVHGRDWTIMNTVAVVLTAAPFAYAGYLTYAETGNLLNAAIIITVISPLGLLNKQPAVVEGYNTIVQQLGGKPI